MTLTEKAKRALELDEKATKGPWLNDGVTIHSSKYKPYSDEGYVVGCDKYNGGGVLKGEHDEKFIAESRTLLPDLAKGYLKVVELLRAANFIMIQNDEDMVCRVNEDIDKFLLEEK